MPGKNADPLFFFSLARASESSRRIERVVPIGVDEHI